MLDSRPSSPPARMKGIGFANVEHYVTTTYGRESWERVLQTLPEEERGERRATVAVGWYPVLHFVNVLHAVDRVCGCGDLGLMSAIGRHGAEQDLNRVLRTFLRVVSPSYVFQIEARLWKHFQDSGRWSTHTVPGGAEATLSGWTVDRALCLQLVAYVQRLLEFTGAQGIQLSHERCRALGAAQCHYRIRWR